MAEGMEKGEWEKQKGALDKNSDFHMGEVVDPVQALIERVGWENAWDKINEDFEANPNDAEARRQANLMVTLSEKRTAELKKKLSH